MVALEDRISEALANHAGPRPSTTATTSHTPYDRCDGGATLFMYGPDAERIAEVIRPILRGGTACRPGRVSSSASAPSHSSRPSPKARKETDDDHVRHRPRPIPRGPSIVGGSWDPLTDTMTGGHWERASHGGLCRGYLRKRPAVIGPHLHWNGAYDGACAKGVHCDGPSCRRATPEDVAYTREREIAEIALWHPDLATEERARSGRGGSCSGVWQGLGAHGELHRTGTVRQLASLEGRRLGMPRPGSDPTTWRTTPPAPIHVVTAGGSGGHRASSSCPCRPAQRRDVSEPGRLVFISPRSREPLQGGGDASWPELQPGRSDAHRRP